MRGIIAAVIVSALIGLAVDQIFPETHIAVFFLIGIACGIIVPAIVERN
jgi:hypothetical protein